MSQSSNTNPSSQNDEIDLGQLFNQIGNAFNKLFGFVGSIFKGIFESIITLLIVLRINIIGFIIALIVGGSFGLLFQFITPKVYEGTMVVEPNFQSSRQLYNNIAYYNTLVEQKDSYQLSKVLGINEEQASSINEFKIQPVISESASLKRYSELILGLDSLSRVETNYRMFLNALGPTDYVEHKIVVSSLDRHIYPFLRKPILASISENEYFKQKQRVILKNISLNDSLTHVSLRETDSLRRIYEKVLTVDLEPYGMGHLNISKNLIQDNVDKNIITIECYYLKNE